MWNDFYADPQPIRVQPNYWERGVACYYAMQQFIMISDVLLRLAI